MFLVVALVAAVFCLSYGLGRHGDRFDRCMQREIACRRPV
jgi:hypothetical protein